MVLGDLATKRWMLGTCQGAVSATSDLDYYLDEFVFASIGADHAVGASSSTALCQQAMAVEPTLAVPANRSSLRVETLEFELVDAPEPNTRCWGHLSQVDTRF